MILNKVQALHGFDPSDSQKGSETAGEQLWNPLQVLHNFPNVNEMREHLVANKHVEGVSQKEISSILKWIGYDPKPEFDALRRHLENRLLYSES
ncbi:MAG: hypothetical protein IKS22_09735, partial [Bacteroidales bacterium]|nr:hypothetical protein [Bacteroidales bacterium]